MGFLSNVFEYFNFITLILLVLSLRNNRDHIEFLLFMLAVFLFESIIVSYLKYNKLDIIHFYNLYAQFCLGFYSYFVGRRLYPGKINQVIKAIFIAYFTCSLFYIITGHPKELTNKLYLTGLLIIFMIILRYVYQILFIDNATRIFLNPVLWLSIGVVLFLSTNFPELLFLEYRRHNVLIFAKFETFFQIGNIMLSAGYFMTSLCLLRSR